MVIRMVILYGTSTLLLYLMTQKIAQLVFSGHLLCPIHCSMNSTDLEKHTVIESTISNPGHMLSESQEAKRCNSKFNLISMKSNFQ
jgi:hypothetical protein